MATETWDQPKNDPRLPDGGFRHLLAAPWFYRLGFAAGRRIPPAVLYRIGDAIGLATYIACPAQAKIVHRNLERLLPVVSERERFRIVRRIFRNYARSLVDYGRFRWLQADVVEATLKDVEGEQNFREALSLEKGVILVTGHIGNWELGGAFFGSRGLKVNVVTVSDGTQQIDDIRSRYRNRYSVQTIMLDGSPFGSLELLAALRRGEMVAMLIDRWGKTDGIPVPSLGGTTQYFPRGPFALSRATGAPILPAFVVRDGAAYRGIIESPFVVAQDDFNPYATQVGAVFERVIRRYPDQWYRFTAI